MIKIDTERERGGGVSVHTCTRKRRWKREKGGEERMVELEWMQGEEEVPFQTVSRDSPLILCVRETACV